MTQKKSDVVRWRQEFCKRFRSYLPLICKLLLLVFIAIHAFNMRYAPVIGGIDPSWQYNINYSFHKHVNVVFTSGPLGFLNYPLNIGSNLDIAVLIRLFVWVCFCGLFSVLVLNNFFSLNNLSLFALLFSFGSFLSFDYFICFIIIFLISLAFFSERWYVFYVIAIALSAALCLMKLSAGLLAISSCGVFTIITMISEKKKGRYVLLLTCIGIPGLFIIFYLLYNQSLSGILSYLKGGYEISAGYNVAMSLRGERRRALLLVIIFAVAYFTLILQLYKTRQKSFFLSLMCIPSIFIGFKHGFVRQDGHEMFFFTFTLVVLGLLFLFTELKNIKKRVLFVLIPIIIPCISPDFLLYKPSPNILHTILRNVVNISGRYKIKTMMMLIHHSRTKEALDVASHKALKDYKLPQDWLQTIGKRSLGSFPWEATYIPANDLNYRPFPVIQAYSAYTPYLDMLNARYLEDEHSAPEFILMEWLSMHGRHPLINVPAMWLALYKWYDMEKWEEHLSPSAAYTQLSVGRLQDNLRPLMLLKRRQTPRFQTLELIKNQEYKSNEFMELPVSDQPVIMSLSMKLTLLGKLSKTFFKIPAVWIELITDAGYQKFRVVPDTLNDGMMIDTLPLNLRDVYYLLHKNQARGQVFAFRISGKGMSLYEKTMSIEFYKIPELHLERFRLPALSSIPQTSSSTLYNIENIDTYEISEPTDTQQKFVLITGWAVDDKLQDKAGGIYIEIDGRLFPAYYGFPRKDVAEFFHVPKYAFSGFQAGIPAAKLGKGNHSLSVKVLTKDKKMYYAPERTMNFGID